MKNSLKLIAFIMALILFISSCNGSKYATGARHNRGVSNRGYSGY